MYDNIRIIKIIKSNGVQLEVDWNLDLQNRKISRSQIDYTLFLKLFDLKKKFQNSDIKEQNLLLLSETGEYYYCNNCIFGFSIDLLDMNVHIYCDSIDYIIKNSKEKYEDIRTKEIQVQFEVPKFIQHNYISNNMEFYYRSSKKVIFKKKYYDNKCVLYLSIKSSFKVSLSILNKILYEIYEILMLYLGTGLKIISRIIVSENYKMEYYSSIADKYGYEDKTSLRSSNIVMIDSNTLNKNVLKTYEDIVKKTYILKDVYFAITNKKNYKEIKIAMILQAIEGIYRCLYESKTEKLDYYEIIEKIFIEDRTCKLVLSQSDRRKINTVNNDKKEIFLYKSLNHRNYFSHLNENKRKIIFSGKELNYAYWKIVLIFRIYFIKQLGVICNKNLLKDIITDINTFKKNHKIRLTIKK